MKRPLRIALKRRRLLPPSVFLHDVAAAVAVDVAHAHAVREPLPTALGRDAVNRPRLIRVMPIRLGVNEVAFRVADNLRLAVAGDVSEVRRLVIGDGQRDVPPPVARFAFRIFVPRRLCAGKAQHQHVVPLVSVDVVNEAEEILRVGVAPAECTGETGHGGFLAIIALQLERLRGGINLVPLLVVRPGVPVWADDEIGVAVAVEIPGGTALGPKVRSGLVFRPSVNVIIPRLAKRGGQGQSDDNIK